jgi:hypothetical protein
MRPQQIIGLSCFTVSIPRAKNRYCIREFRAAREYFCSLAGREQPALQACSRRLTLANANPCEPALAPTRCAGSGTRVTDKDNGVLLHSVF